MGVIVEENGECPSDDVFMPPSNFSIVEEDCIYRSGFPEPSNFRFLQFLKLKSVVYLCTEPYPEENYEFLKANRIKLFQFGIDGTKEPTAMPGVTITEALKILIAHVRNHPILIHCKRGKVLTELIPCDSGFRFSYTLG